MKVNKVIIAGLFVVFVFGGVSFALASETGQFSNKRGGSVGFERREASLSVEQKSIIDQARELRQADKFEEARDLLVSNNLTMKKRGHGRGAGFAGEDAKLALASGNYEAFVDAHSGVGLPEWFSREKFDTMVRAEQLRQSGDFEEARSIMRSLKD